MNRCKLKGVSEVGAISTTSLEEDYPTFSVGVETGYPAASSNH